MTGVTKFQTHCQSLVTKLNEDITNNFETISSDLERIKFLYPLAKDSQIELSEWSPKDIERSESLKASGNKLFQHRNFHHAINVYNEALLRCPQDNIEAQKLHDIIIANRSAVFFELKEYEKVLKDVDFLKYYSHHPNPHKLSIRAAKACEALKRYAAAYKYYKNALHELDINEDVKNDDKQKQSNEIETKLVSLKGKKDEKSKAANVSNVKVELKNITYPALTSKIIVKSTPELGRYVVAKEDIKAGEIIGVEEPYVSVICKDTYRTNCATCMKSTNQFIACTHCSQACFCSFACKEAALFHKTECKILLSLFDTGVSVNCLMALRMITQRNLKNILKESESLNKERNVVIYKSNDIFNVYNLVSHAERRNTTEFIHYTFMSTYLLRLLKMTDFFGNPSHDHAISEEEAYIGSLILKNLQILQFNSHEISEIQYNLDKGKDDAKYKSETVGAGLYPTLALFNHSCDPSVIRYNIGNIMVLRSIKPIKRNEGVYENYGPLYTNDSREQRIEKMKKLYWFECQCQACTENWPLFGNIDDTILRVACQCGNVIQASKDLETPTLSCLKCKKDKTIMPVLAALIPLEAKSSKEEQLFCKGSYKEAMDIIIDMLQTYLKFLVPPFRDMILLQQRLKTCLVHCGNKKFDYKD